MSGRVKSGADPLRPPIRLQRNHIKADRARRVLRVLRQKHPRRSDDAALFAQIHAGCGTAEIAAVAATHFNHYECSAFQADQIEFAAAAAVVLTERPQASRVQQCLSS